jgi:DNA-binding NarL/FixJ family response regulator
VSGPTERTDPPLAGRERELAAGFELVDAVRRGRPALLELVGEGGIGKTALATAVAARAGERGVRVVRARAAAFERDVPYALWIALLDEPAEALAPTALDALGPDRLAELARLLPRLAPAAAGAPPALLGASSEARFRLHRAVGALVAALAARGPLALVLDDLHWADAASLELTLHLLRHPPSAGVLFVVASRPGAAASAVSEAGRDLRDRRQLQLGPLSDAAARSLLAEADDAAELLARAQGNPFFLLELARARRDGAAVPRSVLAAVEATVAALPADARALLEGGALVGDPFETSLAEVAAGLSAGAAPQAVDVLLDARLLELDGGDLRCRFRHPLVREAVHERIGVERRRAGHAALAQALLARGAGPRAVAPHLAVSALPGDEDAIARLDAAAADAQVVAPDAAARWLEAAERLLPAAAGDRRLGLRLRRAMALSASGRVDAAHEVLLAVHDGLPPGSPLAVPTAVQLAMVERAAGRAADSRARLERALASGMARDPGEEAELRTALAFTLVQLAAREAGNAVHAALAAAEAAGSRYAIASARALSSMAASWAGDHAAAAALVDQALGELALVTDEELMRGLETTYTLGLVAIAHERFAAADALLERGATLARRSGQDHALAALLTFRGMSSWNLGELRRALELVSEAVQLTRLIAAEGLLGHALSLSCHLRVAAGERDAAARDGEEALRVLAAQQRDTITLTSRFNVVLFRWADADPARALREATATAGADLAPIDPAWSCQVADELVRCALRVDDLEQARRWAALTRRRADHLGLPLARANAAAAEALVLTAGAPDAAVQKAREAVALVEPLGLPPHTAATRRVLGEALVAAGATEAAATELQAAADGFASCAMQRPHAATARAIRRLGGRVAGRVERAAPADPDGALDQLTEREREIARLVAAGAPNKRIGATLHLSEKTVANHLTRIYAKLDLRHRTELAALAAGAQQRDGDP